MFLGINNNLLLSFSAQIYEFAEQADKAYFLRDYNVQLNPELMTLSYVSESLENLECVLTDPRVSEALYARSNHHLQFKFSNYFSPFLESSEICSALESSSVQKLDFLIANNIFNFGFFNLPSNPTIYISRTSPKDSTTMPDYLSENIL